MNSQVIITGDFNIDLLKIADKEVLVEYFDMLTSHSFFPKITFPTRLSNKHDTLIDNCLCKLTENTIDTTNGIPINKLSDHQPYFTVLNSIYHKNNVPKYIKITKININYCILHDIIQNAKAKHMPHRTVKLKTHKNKKSSWITHGII